MAINVTNYGVQNWIITPAAYAVNETPPTDVSDQRWLVMLSGVGEVNMEGTSAAAWQANQVSMLGDADASVQASWGPRGQTAGGLKPSYYPGYWARYPLAATGANAPKSWRKSEFEWGFVHDGHRDETRNAWAFVAGATFLAAKDSPANIATNAPVAGTISASPSTPALWGVFSNGE